MTSRSLALADASLTERYLLLAEDFAREQVPATLIVTCTYRSVEDQKAVYAQGRTAPGKVITNCDGVVKKSMHNYQPSRAIDVAVMLGGAIAWREDLYHPLVDLCRRYGLISGGSWRTFKDWPHIEMEAA